MVQNLVHVRAVLSCTTSHPKDLVFRGRELSYQDESRVLHDELQSGQEQCLQGGTGDGSNSHQSQGQALDRHGRNIDESQRSEGRSPC